MRVAQVPPPALNAVTKPVSQEEVHTEAFFAPNARTALSSMTYQVVSSSFPVWSIISRLQIVLRYVTYAYENSSLNK
jgi:carbon starvation protein CstA